jgi:hypothetical protein
MMNRLVSLLCIAALGGLLAGCAGMSESSDSGAVSGEAPAAASADRAEGGSGDDGAPAADAPAAGAAVKPADVAKAAAAPATGITRLVRTAEIRVEVKDVGAAARSVRTTAIALGGIVSTENTRFPSAEDGGTDGFSAEDQRSEITLRVPEPKMDDALTKIAAIGKEIDRSTTSEDVTATVVDLESRVATQTRSVARVRELLDRASSLQDVVLLESELARREGDLESIQARQRALVDKAALATVTVTLHAPGAAAEVQEAGFLAGFDEGWTALKASTTVILTVLGALLPVGIVLGLIGLPFYFARRRARANAPEQTPPAATPAPQSTPDPQPASTP